MKTWNPIVNVAAQPEAYSELARKIAKESGHDHTTDVTILPYIQGKIRNDVNNFRSAFRYGSWKKEGSNWVLKPHAKHPLAKVEGAEGISVTVNNDKAKLEALKKAGIEPVALPTTYEEGLPGLEDTRKLHVMSPFVLTLITYHLSGHCVFC